MHDEMTCLKGLQSVTTSMVIVWFLIDMKKTLSLVKQRVSTVDDKKKQERRDKLNSIVGFVWSVRTQGTSSKVDERLNENFERLVRYKQEHGDFLVPHY
jgi:hypothetical protein